MVTDFPSKTVRSHFQNYYERRRRTGIIFGTAFAITALVIFQIFLQIFQETSKIIITASIGYGIGFFGSLQRYDKRNRDQYAYYCEIAENFNLHYKSRENNESYLFSLDLDKTTIQVVDDLIFVYYRFENDVNLLILKKLPDKHVINPPTERIEPFYPKINKLQSSGFDEMLTGSFADRKGIEELLDDVKSIYMYITDDIVEFNRIEFLNSYRNLIDQQEIPEEYSCRVSCLEKLEEEAGKVIEMIPNSELMSSRNSLENF